jgi:hypothetical protein
MRKILAPIIVLLLINLSCTSTLQEETIQTAIAETQKVQLTKTPTYFDVPTLSPSKSATITKTRTETRNLTPSTTPTITETFTVTATITVTNTSTITPSPSPTEDLSLNIKLQNFDSYYNNLTDLQQEAFIRNLSGKTVDWNGYVDDVLDDGTVIVHIPETYIGAVYLQHVPLDVAATINKNNYIHFTGTIESASDTLTLSVYLIDVGFVK